MDDRSCHFSVFTQMFDRWELVGEHLEEMRRESPINVDRRHEEEFPLWFRNRVVDIYALRYLRGNLVYLLKCDWFDLSTQNLGLEKSGRFVSINTSRKWYKDDPFVLASQDDIMPAGGKRLRCDSSIRAETMSGIRHVRGSTRGIALLKARTGGKLTVHIPDGRTAVMTRRPQCSRVILVRLFDNMSHLIRRRSAINKENRAKLKIVHTSGARSFQRMRALLKNPESDEISPALLYKKTHTNKDGMWTSEDARENFEKMKALQLQYESEGKSYTEVEIFAEVLGTKAGYVRGLGRSVRSVGSSSSVSSVDLSRKLEDARLQIEEMRARQLEYETLLVKQSDMEQTMREHLQMMEEQQQKKDEELMQMMAEQ
ncbi:hypothetical protein CJ030_MR7G016694 [Morella rubra]|uniref:DUF4216 domain-containing protein n=1 Tax=Morella rubra TaxID=262757 RepID=A0A6A1V159_9ROSI|nr:hypothetical protein CJ030_MR7G016694 [Morella rubra]